MSLSRSISEGDVRAARRARVAVSALFLTNGALFANVVPRYPEIKDALHLTNAEFGIAVAAFPLGALLVGLSAGMLIRRFRSSRIAVAATVLVAAGQVAVGLAPEWIFLVLALFIAGAADSIADVAQNVHGLRVQRVLQRSIINSFHAVWCIGAVVGGAMGAAAAALELPLAVHLCVSGLLFAAVALVSSRWLLAGADTAEAEGTSAMSAQSRDSHGRGTPRMLTKYGMLFALVGIAISGVLIEDAGNSWSAIYLSDTLGASASVAGWGFIAMQGMQLVGRLVGDRMVDGIGQRAVARIGGVLVLAGTGLSLVLPGAVGAIAGFGVVGFGIATLIPSAMQAADELPGFAPGSGLTLIGWLHRLGFLLSPPIIGAIADATSLRVGLLVIPLAGAFVLVVSGVLTGRPNRERASLGVR